MFLLVYELYRHQALFDRSAPLTTGEYALVITAFTLYLSRTQQLKIKVRIKCRE